VIISLNLKITTIIELLLAKLTHYDRISHLNENKEFLFSCTGNDSYFLFYIYAKRRQIFMTLPWTILKFCYKYFQWLNVFEHFMCIFIYSRCIKNEYKQNKEVVFFAMRCNFSLIYQIVYISKHEDRVFSN
jgi:hypothetical protein